MKKVTLEINIKVQGALDDFCYHAEINGDNQLWASGRTAAEAIGNLLIQRQKELEIKINN